MQNEPVPVNGFRLNDMFIKYKPVKEFRLNFDGYIGSQFDNLRVKTVNSESYKVGENKYLPTNRRWIQLLDGADKITKGYIEENGRLRLSDLAKRKYRYKVIPCESLKDEIDKLSQKPKYRAALKNPPNENDIDGFSIPGKRRIYLKEKLSEEDKNFVIAHELSHYLLGHEGVIFFRASSKEKNHERGVYKEEADKLAAILLMPYIYMQELVNKSDEELARHFKVPVGAVRKRKEELETEMKVFCYIPPSIMVFV